MIEALLRSLDSLGPFAQGVLGLAAFAVAVTIGRLVLRGVRHSSNTFFRFMSRDLVLKLIIHKKFVNSPGSSMPYGETSLSLPKCCGGL